MFKRYLVYLSVAALASMSLVATAPSSAYAKKAKTYYVDVAKGNDSKGNGGSAKPWKTIGRAASVATAGDTVKIRSGTYREAVRPANSGTAGSPITYEPDAGADVTVSGADLLTGSWPEHSGDIYQKAAALPMGDLYREQIYVDGVAQTLARSPNSALGNLYDPVFWNYKNTASTDRLLNDPVNLNQPAGTWDGAAIMAEDSGQWNFSGSLVGSSTPGNLNLKRDQRNYSLKLSSYDNTLRLVGADGSVLGTHEMAVSLDTTYNLKVAASGSSLQVFVNNEASPVISVTDGALAEGSFGLGVESNSGSVAATAEFSNVNATATRSDPNQSPGRNAATFGNIRGWKKPQDAGWWEAYGSTLRGYTQPQLDSGAAWYESSTTAKDFTYSADVRLTAAGTAYMTFRKERSPGWTIGLADWGLGNSEYLIMGKLSLLDAPGEWFYDEAAGQVYLRTVASDDPASHTIEYKARDYAFDLYGKSYTVIKGLRIFGATIDTTDGSNNVIDGIHAKYVTDYNLPTGYTSGICLCGTDDTLKNSEIAFSSSSLVTIKGDKNRLVNNLIHDAGYGGVVFDPAVNIFGRQQLVSHNTIHTGGNILIGGDFYASVIQYNHVHDGTALAEDGGLLYTAHNNLGYSEIHHNWFHDPMFRSNGDGGFTGGIYADISVSNLLVYDNVTWNFGFPAIIINAISNFVHVYNNTTFNTSTIRVSDNAGDGYGDRIINNIATGELTTGSAGSMASHNFTSGDPSYVDPAATDLHLQPSSPARNAGTPIRGITDGYEGSAPDIGAYEVGGADWTAGHNFADPPSDTYKTVDIDFKDLLVNGTLDLNRINDPRVNSLWGWTRTHSQTAQPAYDHAGGFESSRIAFKTGVSLGTGEDGIEQTVTGLKPNTTYEVRGFLRANSDGQSVRLGVRGYGDADTYQEVTSTSWTEKRFTFTTGATDTSATIYGYKPTTGGYAWVDDISVHALPVALSVSDATVTEGPSGTAQASFTVGLAPASAGPVTVDYTTVDGTATAPDDYTATSGTLTFAPGETSRAVTVPVVGEIGDLEKRFTLTLSNPTAGVEIGDGSGVARIIGPPAPGTIRLNDHTTGTGLNQFEFVGSWGTNVNDTAYQGDVTFSAAADDYYQVRFEGTQAKIITEKHNVLGIVAISIDGGEETLLDLYSPTTLAQQLVYTSPVLPAGQHILKVRLTGTKNDSSGGTWHTADRVDIIS